MLLLFVNQLLIIAMYPFEATIANYKLNHLSCFEIEKEKPKYKANRVFFLSIRSHDVFTLPFPVQSGSQA